MCHYVIRFKSGWFVKVLVLLYNKRIIAWILSEYCSERVLFCMNLWVKIINRNVFTNVSAIIVLYSVSLSNLQYIESHTQTAWLWLMGTDIKESWFWLAITWLPPLEIRQLSCDWHIVKIDIKTHYFNNEIVLTWIEKNIGNIWICF